MEQRAEFVAQKRRPRVGRTGRLAGLHAFERTPVATTGRRPSTWDAKASVRTEETRNRELPVGESSLFWAGRRSNVVGPQGFLSTDFTDRIAIETVFYLDNPFTTFE